MADLSSSEQKINDIETAQNAPVSEALKQKIGGSINWCIDEVNTLNEARAKVWYETGYQSIAGSPGETTAFTYSVTLTANDFVEIIIPTYDMRGANNASGSIKIKRGATVLHTGATQTFTGGSFTTNTITDTPILIDKPGAGTYSYTIVFDFNGGTDKAYLGRASFKTILSE